MQTTANAFSDLSHREMQVLQYLMQGKSNKSIADQLYLSERTIKFHCSNIYKKLNIDNRTNLIIKMAEKLYQGTGD
ncbi:MAG: response regulator transcription factor [Aestuariibacter sp.]